MLVNLNAILPQANADKRSIASFNTFGIEYAKVCICAAEQLQVPVILSINLDMTNYVAIEAYSALLIKMAQASSAQICVHLDHCYDINQVLRAMDAGVSSIMFDGSQLPLDQNIARTRFVVNKAKTYGVSVEAELGSVPYSVGRDHIISALTKVEEVAPFIEQSGCDALAISIGNIHRLQNETVTINYELLEQIESKASIPLVVHGASGIATHDLCRLAKESNIAKCNIGTALRVAWYDLVKAEVNNNESGDTLSVISSITDKLQAVCVRYMSVLL